MHLKYTSLYVSVYGEPVSNVTKPCRCLARGRSLCVRENVRRRSVKSNEYCYEFELKISVRLPAAVSRLDITKSGVLFSAVVPPNGSSFRTTRVLLSIIVCRYNVFNIDIRFRQLRSDDV